MRFATSYSPISLTLLTFKENASMSIYAPVVNPVFNQEFSTDLVEINQTSSKVNQIPAYVYRLVCKPTGQYYIGYRMANIRLGRMPVDDLWKYYFSSSGYVKELIQEHGVSNFDYAIIYEDCDTTKAYFVEQNMIAANIGDPLILNKRCDERDDENKQVFIATPEAGKKAAATRKRRGTDKIGAQKMVDTKTKNGSFKTGAAKAAVTCRERGIIQENAQKSLAARIANGNLSMDAAVEAITKNWEMTNSNGETIIIRNLENFCREHDLDASTMGKVARGKRKSHKGWTCKQLD